VLGAQDIDFALTEALESFQSAVALWTVSCEIGDRSRRRLSSSFFTTKFKSAVPKGTAVRFDLSKGQGIK
jgi:hypothetical protein